MKHTHTQAHLNTLSETADTSINHLWLRSLLLCALPLAWFKNEGGGWQWSPKGKRHDKAIGLLWNNNSIVFYIRKLIISLLKFLKVHIANDGKYCHLLNKHDLNCVYWPLTLYLFFVWKQFAISIWDQLWLARITLPIHQLIIRSIIRSHIWVWGLFNKNLISLIWQ